VCAKDHHVDTHTCTVFGCQQRRYCIYGVIRHTLCDFTKHHTLQPEYLARLEVAKRPTEPPADQEEPQANIESPTETPTDQEIQDNE
jgi:hypothetical protein